MDKHSTVLGAVQAQIRKTLLAPRTLQYTKDNRWIQTVQHRNDETI